MTVAFIGIEVAQAGKTADAARGTRAAFSGHSPGWRESHKEEIKKSQSSTTTIMNKYKSARLNSYIAVQTLLAANSELVATLPALDTATDELVEFITGISAQAQVQSSASGAAEAKARALTELGDVVYEIAGGVLSFAETGGDFTLAGRVRFSRSGVVAGSSNAIVARCQDVIDVATENLASLATHGVTQAKLTSAKQRLKSYEALRVMPRQAKAASAAASRQLEQLFPEVERLLSQRVDKLVWQFRAANPEFYQRYQVAREVVSPATQSADGTPAVVPVTQPHSVAA